MGRAGQVGRADDEGFVLITVMGTMMMLSTLLLMVLASVLANTSASRAAQDSRAATAAAQSGIDDYLARLNADPDYWLTLNVDSSNPALAPAGAPAGYAGRDLPGLPGIGPQYTYRVLNSVASIRADHVIQLEVTGSSSARNGGRQVRRVLRAALATTGFVDYAYFSDREVADPSLFTTSEPKCANAYFTAGTGRATLNGGNPATICPEVPWTTGDVVTGPVHTNDAPYITGAPTFASAPVETGWPTGSLGKFYWGGGAPVTTAPSYAVPTAMPGVGSSLLRYVEPRPDGGVAGPGCLYKGATRITFTGATMTVYSPGTTNAPLRCLDTTNRAGVQSGLAIPPLIYVQSSVTCAAPLLGYPLAGEYTGATYRDAAGGVTHSTDYTCSRGSAYVSGTVHAAVSVATENDIVVVGDLTVGDRTGGDMVGLMSGGQTWVHHPLLETATGTPVTTCTVLGVSTVIASNGFCLGVKVTTTAYTYAYSNLLPVPVRAIDASILSVAHSFLVQNADRGAPLSTTTSPASKLTVYGSVSQRYRGPVARVSSANAYSSGYLVDYTKDPRLDVQNPPYFLAPSQSPWTVSLVTDG